MKRECVAAEVSVAIEPKMELEEISTSVVGLKFSIEFRHVSDMPMDTENVRLLGKTRSDQRRVKTTRLTRSGHQPAFHISVTKLVSALSKCSSERLL